MDNSNNRNNLDTVNGINNTSNIGYTNNISNIANTGYTNNIGDGNNINSTGNISSTENVGYTNNISDVANAGYTNNIGDGNNINSTGNISSTGNVGYTNNISNVANAGYTNNISDVANAGYTNNIGDGNNINSTGNISSTGNVGYTNNISDVANAGYTNNIGDGNNINSTGNISSTENVGYTNNISNVANAGYTNNIGDGKKNFKINIFDNMDNKKRNIILFASVVLCIILIVFAVLMLSGVIRFDSGLKTTYANQDSSVWINYLLSKEITDVKLTRIRNKEFGDSINMEKTVDLTIDEFKTFLNKLNNYKLQRTYALSLGKINKDHLTATYIVNGNECKFELHHSSIFLNDCDNELIEMFESNNYLEFNREISDTAGVYEFYMIIDFSNDLFDKYF